MIGAEHSQIETVEPALLSEGDVVGGRYVLSHVLGRGAAGTVWEAEHRLLTSRVAIKFLDTAAMLDPTSAEILAQRFRFEAQISARLGASTKHFVAAHDAGMFRGIPYLVMELVGGDTLEARIAAGPMSVEEVADLLDQIAEPIDGAHAAGIAHRDVKPGNIMVVKSSGPPVYKLGDFGTAKVFGEGLVGLTPPKQTSENTLVGSPAYMSPEYISGLPLVDGCIDVWALSITAYEALTRRLPFDGEVWTQVAVAIVSGEFPPPSTVVPGLSPRFDEIFARAFSKQPADRYLSARHFARAFRLMVSTVQSSSADVEPVVLPVADRSRLWIYGAVGFTAAAALAVGSIFWLAGDEPSKSASAVTTSAQETGSSVSAVTDSSRVVATAQPQDTASASGEAAPSETPSSTAKGPPLRKTAIARPVGTFESQPTVAGPRGSVDRSETH